MATAGDGGGEALDAYVDTRYGDGIPEGVSAPKHARAQADILATDLMAQEAKAVERTAEISQRLASLREHKTIAATVDPGEYPQVAAAAEEIERREAKAAAELSAIDTALNAQREAVAAAMAEADRLEAEAPEEN